MNIVFPSNTKATIDAIRNAIGRDVTIVYKAGVTPCPVCDLDPINNTSVDSFCETCSGLYWIPVYSGEIVNAHITWKPTDRLGWVTGGFMYDGDCLIQIEYTERNDSLTQPKTVVLVDSKELYIETKLPRGVPTINRLLLGLKERNKENE